LTLKGSPRPRFRLERTVALASLGVLAACGSPPSSTSPATTSKGVVAAASARAPGPAAVVAPAPIDPEPARIFALTRGFRLGAPTRITPTSDGKLVFFLRASARDPRQSLWEADVASGRVRELLTPEAVAKGPETLTAAERARRERLRINTTGFTSFEATDDGARVLLTLSGRLFLLTRATGEVKELATGAGVVDPHLSRDGKRVGYVRGNDLYALSLDAGAREVAVTRGGTDLITHGSAEFIAQEELDRSRGFWWSPDGRDILYEEANSTDVEELTIVDAAHLEKAPDRTRYPRPGKKNARLRFAIGRSEGTGPTRFVKWDAEAFPYVATVGWERFGPPTMYVLDRAQKHGLLLAIDVKDGSTTTLVDEHDDAWLNVDPSVPRWLAGGTAFLWSSEKSGAWELALHDAKGKPLQTIATKDRGYQELLAVDEAKHAVYIDGSPEPSEPRVVALPLGKGEAADVAVVPNGSAHARFGDGASTFVTIEASRSEMPRYAVRTIEGRHFELPSVAEAPPSVPSVEILKAGADGTRVGVVRPKDFVASRKYPVIDAAYGGPGYNVVLADASKWIRAQWMADVTQSIVVGIDARGTPGRGRAWERPLRGKLGSVPLEGHVAALRELGRTTPALDLEHVGIYGWSFGGYLAALAVTARPDFYKVAVAGAPPADWRDYDTCYTERYLGMPDTDAAAYDEASLLTWAAKKGSGNAPRATGALLLVHGTADDNVYFANSLKLADALGRAGHRFEFLPVAGVTHQLFAPDSSAPVWTKAAEFLREGLK
jgi:dipeptidyl-peptidase-4